MTRALGVAAFFLAFGLAGNDSYVQAIEQDADEKVMRVHRVLLETSMQPATLEECERAHPKRPRPDGVISLQNGSLTPWHHRTCMYLTKGQP